MSHHLYCERPCRVDTIYRGGESPNRRFDVLIKTSVSSSSKSQNDAINAGVYVAMPVEEAEALVHALKAAIREARVQASK